MAERAWQELRALPVRLERKMEPLPARKSPSFALCLIFSLALNLLVVLLLGRVWSPFASVRIANAPRLVRFMVMPPPPRPRPVAHTPHAHKLKPLPRPHPKPRPVVRRATTVAPSRIHHAHIAPRPRPAGAGRLAAPAIAPAPVLSAAPRLPQARMALLKTVAVRAAPALVAVTGPPTLAPSTSLGMGQGSGTGSQSGRGSGTGTGAGTGGGGEPFGVGSGGAGGGEGLRHIVYVLDTSGSMTSRIDRARDEIRAALRGLQPGETFDILTFSDDVHEFDSQLDDSTPAMVERASYFLSTLQIDGGTNLARALRRALSLPGVNVVVLVTDGDPTLDEDGSTIMSDEEDSYFVKFTRRVREMNVNRARIYTIGLVGKDPDGHDKTFAGTRLLQQISRDSGGVSKIVILGTAPPE